MISAAITAPHLRQLIVDHGGFTLRLADGRIPRRGISVCTRPSASRSFAMSDWDDQAVTSWLADRVLDRDRYIGGWLDDRSTTVWLDVVGIVPPRLHSLAYTVGRMMDQHCVFDLARRETVVLQGGPS
jgi:hypothetical protein